MTKKKPGIMLGETDYLQKTADILPGVKEYQFPKDMDELLYLRVDGFYFTIEDQRIVLTQVPRETVQGAITVHYRTL